MSEKLILSSVKHWASRDGGQFRTRCEPQLRDFMYYEENLFYWASGESLNYGDYWWYDTLNEADFHSMNFNRVHSKIARVQFYGEENYII